MARAWTALRRNPTNGLAVAGVPLALLFTAFLAAWGWHTLQWPLRLLPSPRPSG